MAFSAADALVIVNLCAEVFNRDRARFARLDALHAADAAGLALLARLGALVVVFAKHGGLDGVKREQIYKLSRAGFDALFAGAAPARVDSCNAVADENCFIGANLNADIIEETLSNTASISGAGRPAAHSFGRECAAGLFSFKSVFRSSSRQCAGWK